MRSLFRRTTCSPFDRNRRSSPRGYSRQCLRCGHPIIPGTPPSAGWCLHALVRVARPPAGIDGLSPESTHASTSVASPMPSMDRKARHSSALSALAATNLRACPAVLSASGSTASIPAGSDFAAIPPTVRDGSEPPSEHQPGPVRFKPRLITKLRVASEVRLRGIRSAAAIAGGRAWLLVRYSV